MYGSDILGGDPARWTTGLLGKAAAAAGSTLLNGLVAYWPLDEQSGTRADAVGSNDLTDNNTVGVSLAGPSGTVARLVAANTESFSNATVFDSMAGKSGTFLTWVKQDSVTGAWMFGGSAGGWNSSVEAFVSGTNYKLNIAFYNDDEGKTERDYIEHQNVMLAGWNLIGFTYDHSTKTSTVYVNGVPSDTTSVLSDGLNWDGAPDFQLGGAKVIWSAADDQRGPTGLWERAFSTNEVLGIFNSGSGKHYSDLTAAEKVGLVSYWNLDEVSGTRADSHGANDLTDNNTVGSVNSGPSGTVAKFTDADNDYLSSASEATLEGSGDSWTIALWANLTTPDNNNGRVIARETGGLDYAVLGNAVAINFYGVGTSVTTSPDLTGTGWHLWVFGFDKANNYIFATYDTKAFNTAATTGPYSAAGAKSFSISDGTYGRGDQIGRVGFWRKALSLSEIASLFNSGAGKKYADLTAGEKTGLVSYWDLSETSGDRADSHGSNTLTDNNTVGSVVNAGGAMSGAAASFVAANTESLTTTLAAAPDLEAGFTLSGWYYPVTAAGSAVHIVDGGSKYIRFYPDGGTPSTHYARFYDGTNDSYATVTGLTNGAWYHFVIWFDTATKKANCSINGAAPQLGGAAAATPDMSGTTSVILAAANTARLDEVAIWSRVLTADERTELWNAGKGVYYNGSDFA